MMAKGQATGAKRTPHAQIGSEWSSTPKTLSRRGFALLTAGGLALAAGVSNAERGGDPARLCPVNAEPVAGECVVVVRHGATLWRISKSVALALGLSPDQVAVGLYQHNPDAFINGDINRLKLGAVLHMPSARNPWDGAATRRLSPDGLGIRVQLPAADMRVVEPHGTPEAVAGESPELVVPRGSTSAHGPLKKYFDPDAIDALLPLTDDLIRIQRNEVPLPDFLSYPDGFSFASESPDTEPKADLAESDAATVVVYRSGDIRASTWQYSAAAVAVTLIGVGGGMAWVRARRPRPVLQRAGCDHGNGAASGAGAVRSATAALQPHTWKASQSSIKPADAITAKLSTAHLLDDLKGRTARGTAVTLVAQAIKVGLQLTSVTVLARLLTPADFGLVAMVTVVTGLLDKFRDGGLSMATVQRGEISQEQVSNLFWINLGLGVVLTTVTIGLSPILAAIYHEPRLIWIGTVLAGSFLIASLAAQHEAILNRQMLFAVIARIDVISMAVGIAAAILAAWGSWGYWSLIVLTMTTGLCRMVLVWLASEWRPTRFRRGTGVRPLLHFGINLTGANFVGYFASNLTPFVIGLVGGAQQLGYYNRANTLMAIPSSQLLPPVMSVAQPALCRLAADPERFGRACLSLIRKVSLLAMFVTVSMVGMADWIVLAFLGPAWESTIGIFRLLAIFALVEPLAATLAMMLIAAGRADALLAWKLVSLIIVCLAALIGTGWGVEGIVTGYALSGLIIRTPLLLWFSSRYLPIRFLAISKNVAQFLFIALFSLVGMLELRTWLGEIAPLVGLIVMALSTAAAYVSVCFIFVAPRADLIELLQLPKRLLSESERGAYANR